MKTLTVMIMLGLVLAIVHEEIKHQNEMEKANQAFNRLDGQLDYVLNVLDKNKIVMTEFDVLALNNIGK